MRLTRWMAAACVAGLVLAGCGEHVSSPEVTGTADAGTNVAGAPGSGDNGQGAPGAPGPGSGNGGGDKGGGNGGGPAPGSPLHMPARTQDQGAELDEKLAYIKEQLTAECGGHLCVDITVEYSHDGRRCEYYGSRPEPDSVFRYRRNMTVTIIAGSDPCEEVSESAEPSESATPGTDEPTTDAPTESS
jgi:hypothetical protein